MYEGEKDGSWILDRDFINPYEKNSLAENGGPGSGNHGHQGRPGKRGGSSKSGGRLGFYNLSEGETFGEATERAKETTINYAGEKFKGKNINVYPKDLRAAGIKPEVSDVLQVNEYESLIESGSSGKVLIAEKDNYQYAVIDGNHTLSAYYKLSARGIEYKVPVVYTEDESIINNTKISQKEKEFIQTER